MNAKQRAQRKHAKRRASERYGVTLNRHQLRSLVEGIQRGRAIFLKMQSHRVSHFLVKLNEQWVPVVYDKQRKTIVTFLPKE